MNRSTDRILSTHVGSIARPKEFLKLALRRENGEDYDYGEFTRAARIAVNNVLRKQVECGLDIVNDGEQAKSGFATYVVGRLSGFESRQGTASFQGPWQDSRDELAFPEYYKKLRDTVPVYYSNTIACVAPIEYVGAEALQFEIDTIQRALKETPAAEAFMTSLSTTNVEWRRDNEYYNTEDEYLQAIADAMHVEYQTIVDAGLLLQIDDPRLSTYYFSNPTLTLAECRAWAEKRVEVLNYALRGISPDRVRFHTCYSIDIGPRVHDMALKDIVDIMLKVNAGGYSFEAANPRHEHEYHVWEEVKLPEGKVLIPGVVSHTTPLVEHPELVAERIVRFANVVGRENVIASADCGFASTTRDEPDMHPSVAWAKLESLGEGARLATQLLWNGKP